MLPAVNLMVDEALEDAVSVKLMREKKDPNRVLFHLLREGFYRMSYGAGRVIGFTSRVTAVPAYSLPFTDAPVASVIDV